MWTLILSFQIMPIWKQLPAYQLGRLEYNYRCLKWFFQQFEAIAAIGFFSNIKIFEDTASSLITEMPGWSFVASLKMHSTEKHLLNQSSHEANILSGDLQGHTRKYANFWCKLFTWVWEICTLILHSALKMQYKQHIFQCHINNDS